MEGIGGRRRIKRNMMFENEDKRYDHGKMFVSCMIWSSVPLYYIDLWTWSPELEQFPASLFQIEQQTGKLV